MLLPLVVDTLYRVGEMDHRGAVVFEDKSTATFCEWVCVRVWGTAARWEKLTHWLFVARCLFMQMRNRCHAWVRPPDRNALGVRSTSGSSPLILPQHPLALILLSPLYSPTLSASICICGTLSCFFFSSPPLINLQLPVACGGNNLILRISR